MASLMRCLEDLYSLSACFTEGCSSERAGNPACDGQCKATRADGTRCTKEMIVTLDVIVLYAYVRT